MKVGDINFHTISTSNMLETISSMFPHMCLMLSDTSNKFSKSRRMHNVGTKMDVTSCTSYLLTCPLPLEV